MSDIEQKMGCLLHKKLGTACRGSQYYLSLVHCLCTFANHLKQKPWILFTKKNIRENNFSIKSLISWTWGKKVKNTQVLIFSSNCSTKENMCKSKLLAYIYFLSGKRFFCYFITFTLQHKSNRLGKNSYSYEHHNWKEYNDEIPTK